MQVSRWSDPNTKSIQYVIKVLAVGFRTAGKEGKGGGRGHTLVGRRRDEELAGAAPLAFASSPLAYR